MALIDLPPVLETPPSYIRQEDGLLVPSRNDLTFAALPGVIPGAGLLGKRDLTSFSVTGGPARILANGLATQHWSGADFDEDSPTRELLIAVQLLGPTNRTVSSVVVGGVTATAVINRNGSTQAYGAHFYKVKVPGQRTGTVTITLSGTITYTCFSDFIPAASVQPADLILESGSFLAEGGSLGG